MCISSEVLRYNDSRKLLYSAYILMLRDMEERKRDPFWDRIEAVLKKHEEQMDIISQRAVDVRSSIAASRKRCSSDHIEEMRKIELQINELQKQIDMFSADRQAERIDALKKKESELEDEVRKVDAQIEGVSKDIDTLRKSNESLKSKIKETKDALRTKSDDLIKRKKEIEAKNRKVMEQLERSKSKLSEIDAEIAELEKREKLCSDLYMSLKEPIQSIDYIFTNPK